MVCFPVKVAYTLKYNFHSYQNNQVAKQQVALNAEIYEVTILSF